MIRTSYLILVAKLEAKRFGRPRCRREDNFIIDDKIG
jgi:hypothetical protein